VFAIESRSTSRDDIREIYDRFANCCINKSVKAVDLTPEMMAALSFWMDVALLRRTHVSQAQP
jgi:hypothetical protein